MWIVKYDSPLNSGFKVASASTKVLICQKFGQNLKNFDKEVSTFFSIFNEMILLCY